MEALLEELAEIDAAAYLEWLAACRMAWAAHEANDVLANAANGVFSGLKGEMV